VGLERWREAQARWQAARLRLRFVIPLDVIQCLHASRCLPCVCVVHDAGKSSCHVRPSGGQHRCDTRELMQGCDKRVTYKSDTYKSDTAVNTRAIQQVTYKSDTAVHPDTMRTDLQAECKGTVVVCSRFGVGGSEFRVRGGVQGLAFGDLNPQCKGVVVVCNWVIRIHPQILGRAQWG